MSQTWLLCLTAFAVSFAISLLTTPMAKDLAYRFKAVDFPRSRGMNNEPVPRMGGLAIVLGFTGALVLMSFFMRDFITVQFLGFTIGAVIIVVVGMLDDIYELSAKFKLAIQIIVAAIVVATGTKLDFIMWPFWQYLKPFSAVITVIWIVGLINAVNLIDGLDGLASGVTTIAAVCLTILCVLKGNNILAVVISASLAGASLGFLPRNFAPAEVYMGDTGSTFLGYVLAVCSCIGVFKGYAILSLLLSTLAMALPMIDTAFAMIRRAVHHQPIMSPDRGHLHHRLVDSGLTSQQAVIVLYALSSVSCLIAVAIAFDDYRFTLSLMLALFVVIMMIMVYSKRT